MVAELTAVQGALERKVPSMPFPIDIGRKGQIDSEGIRCPKCDQATVVCCHFDTNATEHLHEDHYAHVCLDDECDYGEHWSLESQEGEACPFCSA